MSTIDPRKIEMDDEVTPEVTKKPPPKKLPPEKPAEVEIKHEHPVRQFNEIIFLGDGYRSMGRVHLLHKRLEEAIDNLNYIQQGGEDNDNYKTAEQGIMDVVQDVAMALLGYKVKFFAPNGGATGNE